MKRFKGCLGVFLIFFFGVLFGCAITMAGIDKKMTDLIRGGPDEITDGTVRWLKRDLKLDKAQEEMLHHITMETRIKLRTIRQTTQPQVEQTLIEAAERVRGILNPDQTRKFDERVQKAMKKWKASESGPTATPSPKEPQSPPAPEVPDQTEAPAPAETP